jgi:GDP-mannose 6-dehydrogenase
MGVDLPMIANLDRSNQSQIAEALRMVRATGAKRVAVLGLAFKRGTDDLRESPILEVIAALQADGVEVTAHDEAVTPETRIEAQLAYVEHASPGLRALAPRLAGMIAPDADSAVNGAEAVIVTHACEAYRRVAATTDAPVIDLVRLFRDPADQPAGVSGIGW